MIRELLPQNVDMQLLARVAAARDATVIASPEVGDYEMRRAGNVWLCSPRTAANLRALLSHR